MQYAKAFSLLAAVFCYVMVAVAIEDKGQVMMGISGSIFLAAFFVILAINSLKSRS